jgi:hypothetical protein
MGADPGRHASRSAAGQLLEEDRLVEYAGVAAAIFLGVLESQQVECPEPLEELPRKLLRFLPGVDLRTDLLLDEAADGAPKLLVLRREQMRPGRAYVCQ